jgi:hypothetical protein
MNNSYFEICNEHFGYFISNMQLNLQKNNKNYLELEKEIQKLFSEYPNVNKMFESTNPCKLNNDECLALISVLTKLLSQKYIELEEMFFKGQKEMLYSINRMNYFDTNEDTNKNC